MRALRKPARVAGAVAALALTGAVACGGDGAGAGAGGRDMGGGEPVGRTTASSPFTVAHPPAGHRLVQAGRGTMPQSWSSDSFGDDEPVTVLAPADAGPGAPGAPDVVRVSLTGFEGFQGGLAQASEGYLGEESESFELDGRRAIYTPGRPGEGAPADLVAVAGDDLAIRVQAAGATRDELVAVARQVEPGEDHLLAPAVPDPPGDLEVVGWADADVALTLTTSPTPASESLPAGERAHSAVWAQGAPGTAWTLESGTVAVSTLPGQALDLDALTASLHRHEYLGEPRATSRRVDGRPGAVLEAPGDRDDGYPGLRAVVTSTPDGDLLVVVAHGAELAAVEELVAVAASVEPATPEEWDATVLQARGGPGLRPDDGAVELARGTAGDVEWLLQSRVDDGTVDDGLSTSHDPDTTGQHVVDPCLKLAGGERACPTGAHESYIPSGGIVTMNTARPSELDAGGAFPAFVLVTTTDLPAATVRVHTGDGPVDVPLVALPGGARRAAVLVTESDPGLNVSCGPGTGPGTVTLLDPANHPLPC